MSTKYPQYPLSTFPDSVDNIPNFLDVTPTDADLITQYQTAVSKGDFSLAEEVYKLIPNANQKILSAVRLNTLRDSILATEKFYKDDVKDYIDMKQTEWDNIVSLLEYKGEWQVGTQYYANNMVTYTLNGKSVLYLNIGRNATPVGSPPTNTAYWRILTVEGAKGDAGIGTTFEYAWNTAETYKANTIVTHNDRWWVSVQSNVNQEPSESSTYWKLVLSANQTMYPIQKESPVSQKEGELWFRVLEE